MSVSVKAWVFSSFPRQSPDQSLWQPVDVAATQWHCQLPGLGEAPTERDSRPSSKLELFTVFSWIWPCTLSQDGPPLSWPSLCHAQRETPCVLQSPVCSRDNILQDASRCQHVTSVRPGNNKCLNSVWWDTTLYIKTGSIIIASHFAAFCACFVSLSSPGKWNVYCVHYCVLLSHHILSSSFILIILGRQDPRLLSPQDDSLSWRQGQWADYIHSDSERYVSSLVMKL